MSACPIFKLFGWPMNFIPVILDALKHYRTKLTEFEQNEILDYPEIWYLGIDSDKIQARVGSAHNSGYDDENGSYLKVRPISE